MYPGACSGTYDGSFGLMPRTRWLTQWTLELLPWWGQYQNCNGYGAAHSCISSEHFLVGRESPEYLRTILR